MAQPSHFALGALRVLRIGKAGAVVSSPPLRSRAGTLDVLQWIGGNGRALAGFGMGGAYYRPAHADPAPELACVDGARGRVLGRLPLATLFPRRDPASLSVTAVHWASGIARAGAGALDAGASADRVHASAPGRRLDAGRAAAGGSRLPPDPRAASGSHPAVLRAVDALFARAAAATRHRRAAGAARRDRHLIWSLRATAVSFWQGDVLRVAPDGTRALVSYPPAADRTERLAVVRVGNGRVEPVLPGGSEAGIARGGRLIWVCTGGGGLRYWTLAGR